VKLCAFAARAFRSQHPDLWVKRVNLLQATMGRGHGRRKDFFQRGPLGDFPKIFSRGGQSGKVWFLSIEIEKATFFANNFKLQGGPWPPCPPLPTPMVAACAHNFPRLCEDQGFSNFFAHVPLSIQSIISRHLNYAGVKIQLYK